MAYSGSLNHNEIFSAIYNMIISQEVFADNIGKHQTLVDKARVDGGLSGDTKLYYATDALKSSEWGKDAEAANLLALHRPAAPNCQAITLDKFRQICLTVDNYLTKRAFSDEGTFGAFNSVMLGWMRDTKKIYEGTLYNTFIGTTQTRVGKQLRGIALEGTEQDGQILAEAIANILVEMGDYSRDFNDLGYLRSYADADIQIIWNSKYVNKVKKMDLPTIFHKEGLVDKLDQDVIPARYFGTVNTSGGTTPATNTSIRSLIEKDYGNDHVMPGDLLPGSKAYLANETYTEGDDIVCKIITKLPPIMSAFEAGTSFFNPKSLTENHYLTWGMNTLAYFQDKPFVTVVNEA